MQYTGLMSVYRSEKVNLLEKSFDSILNQTKLPTEFVLIKDGPLTKKLNNCITNFEKQAQGKNIQVKILENKKNLGLGKSLQRGVKECSCEWIARFDSDDISIATRMEKSMDYVEKNHEVKILGGYISEFSGSPDEPVNIRKVPITNQEIKGRINTRNPFNHMSVFFEKEAILNVGNYQDVPYFEDYYLWFRLIKQGYQASNLPEVLVNAHVDNDFYKKRGGSQYLKKELYFQKLVFSKGYISRKRYFMNVVTRGLVRLMPKRALKLAYSFLRK